MSRTEPPSRGWLMRLLYWGRDLRYGGALFDALRDHVRGDVLDVGGGDFFRRVEARGIGFDRWTCLEKGDPATRPGVEEGHFRKLYGDGCAMTFADASFDTVLAIEVLEHVYEPLRMMAEMSRVLRPGGTLIVLVPQTSNLHLTPHHYYNFTRFWVLEATERHRLELLRHEPLGGAWSTLASRQVLSLLQLFRFRPLTYPEARRRAAFPFLLPLMLLHTALSVPICLLLSLGDLEEEANTHLLVARKPG